MSCAERTSSALLEVGAVGALSRSGEALLAIGDGTNRLAIAYGFARGGPPHGGWGVAHTGGATGRSDRASSIDGIVQAPKVTALRSIV